jgi:hypothetical protein
MARENPAEQRKIHVFCADAVIQKMKQFHGTNVRCSESVDEESPTTGDWMPASRTSRLAIRNWQCLFRFLLRNQSILSSRLNF